MSDIKISFADRLKTVIDGLGHSGNSFGEEVGMGGSLVNKTLRGESLPTVKIIHRIAEHFPEINWDYMITGRGQPFLTPEEEKYGLKGMVPTPKPTPHVLAEERADYKKGKSGEVTFSDLENLEERLRIMIRKHTAGTLEAMKMMLMNDDDELMFIERFKSEIKSQ